MKQDIIGFVAFAILVPFIIVSTWFGISAVNHHFKSQQEAAVEVQREAERQKYSDYLQCVRETMKPEDKTSTQYCLRPLRS